jgi:hypothetical protein
MLNVVAAEHYRGKKAHLVCDHTPDLVRPHRLGCGRQSAPIAEQFTTTLRCGIGCCPPEPANAIMAS